MFSNDSSRFLFAFDTEKIKQQQDDERVLQSVFITNVMRERCKIVFEAILNYCVKTLKIDQDGTVKNLDEELKEDVYCTVLYNDETHTFEQVIATLTRMVGWANK